MNRIGPTTFPIIRSICSFPGTRMAARFDLPLIGAPYLPQLGEKYPWGMRKIGSLVLYTNAGIGTIRIPMRLNCAPEVTLITLRAAPEIPSKR